MTIWKQPLRRRPDRFIIMYNPGCLAVNTLLKEVSETRKVAPLYSAQSGLTYTFTPAS
jgi:hypothetical protein